MLLSLSTQPSIQNHKKFEFFKFKFENFIELLLLFLDVCVGTPGISAYNLPFKTIKVKFFAQNFHLLQNFFVLYLYKKLNSWFNHQILIVVIKIFIYFQIPIVIVIF